MEPKGKLVDGKIVQGLIWENYMMKYRINKNWIVEKASTETAAKSETRLQNRTARETLQVEVGPRISFLFPVFKLKKGMPLCLYGIDRQFKSMFFLKKNKKYLIFLKYKIKLGLNININIYKINQPSILFWKYVHMLFVVSN